MSSLYPVLNKRPIDQWKVTELKEELKRRKLITRGLKDDLVRRLDEALRVEAEDFKENVNNGVENEQPLVGVKDGGIVPVDIETPKDVDDGNDNVKVVDVAAQADVNDPVTDKGQVEVQHEGKPDANDSSRVEETPGHATTQTSIMVTETVVSEVMLNEGDLLNSKFQNDSGGSKSQVENVDPKPQLNNPDVPTQLDDEVPKPQLENEDSKAHLRNEVLTAPYEDTKHDLTAPANQVSEVSPVLGSQVKSDSISTASVCINETIELKDNIIADNVKIELDVIKPEMVEPSSSNVEQVDGKSHPMDVEEPLENKAPLEEKEGDSARNEDMSKKSDSAADLGYSEKFNLDRSSGDDSMEEDVLENKQIDSKYNYNEMRDHNEKTGVHIDKEDTHVDIVGDEISVEKKDVHLDAESEIGLPADKRKLRDQEAPGNSEPLKRQRRWNTESIKLVEPKGPNLTSTTTPKDAFRSTSFKRIFSGTDTTASDDVPKEVPPSQTPPTNSLKIDHFLRPFTLKAVQELLSKTGSVTSFWMDQIKTHCYVTYSSVEEAVQTRDAVYNLQWPPNGGRHLVSEFVDPQEVKIRVEAPQTTFTPLGPSTSNPSAPARQPALHQPVPRQQLPPPPSLPPPPPLSSLPPAAKEQLPPPMSNPPQAMEQLPPPPPLPEKMEPLIVTLDDLFRKTKAIPRIYYLPLSEEQVAAKLNQQGRNTKQ